MLFEVIQWRHVMEGLPARHEQVIVQIPHGSNNGTMLTCPAVFDGDHFRALVNGRKLTTVHRWTTLPMGMQDDLGKDWRVVVEDVEDNYRLVRLAVSGISKNVTGDGIIRVTLSKIGLHKLFLAVRDWRRQQPRYRRWGHVCVVCGQPCDDRTDRCASCAHVSGSVTESGGEGPREEAE